MKQIYFIITFLSTLTIGILPLNLEITFAQNETSEIDNSSLITIHKSMNRWKQTILHLKMKIIYL